MCVYTTERAASKLRECVTISCICRYQARAMWQAAGESVKRRCWVDDQMVQCFGIEYSNVYIKFSSQNKYFLNAVQNHAIFK